MYLWKQTIFHFLPLTKTSAQSQFPACLDLLEFIPLLWYSTNHSPVLLPFWWAGICLWGKYLRNWGLLETYYHQIKLSQPDCWRVQKWHTALFLMPNQFLSSAFGAWGSAMDMDVEKVALQVTDLLWAQLWATWQK